MDRRLEFCAHLLATIQTLEKRGESFESIRLVRLAIAEEYVRPRSLWRRWLKRLPARLIRTPLRRLMVHLVRTRAGVKGHPDGFLVQIVTDPVATHGLGYGIDIVECGVLTFSPGLELIRSGALARGAAKCDFRCRVR